MTIELLHTDLIGSLNYNSVTGIFTNLASGKTTGYKSKNGYLTIRVKNVLYYSHRLAWFYQHKCWPNHIDHIDGNRENNSFSNLRSVLQTQNNKNLGMKTTNKSGYKGVFFMSKNNSWHAYITNNRLRKHLGCFLSAKEAATAYDLAAINLHGLFAKTNKSMGLL